MQSSRVCLNTFCKKNKKEEGLQCTFYSYSAFQRMFCEQLIQEVESSLVQTMSVLIVSLLNSPLLQFCMCAVQQVPEIIRKYSDTVEIPWLNQHMRQEYCAYSKDSIPVMWDNLHIDFGRGPWKTLAIKISGVSGVCRK